ncbi:MAG: DUF2267 domain-containing protein [Candidatus Bathyarchaeia archaeon]
MSTSVRSLDSTIQTTMEWLNIVQEELKWPDEERVYDATKAVLQALRDRLPIEEAHEFAAQLPMLMKGIYFDGYDPTDKPLKIRSREEFLERVRKNFGNQPLDAEKATKAVLRMLYKKLSGGELEDIKGNMPNDIKGLFTAAKKS